MLRAGGIAHKGSPREATGVAGNDGGGRGRAGRTGSLRHSRDPGTHVHTPTARSCWAALGYSQCVFPWQRGFPFLWPCRGYQQGRAAQPAVLCSPPSCSACFLAQNVTAPLPYLMLGFLILSHVGILSSESERYEELFQFGFCFSDTASHLPGAIRVLPSHGRAMFPKPKSSWHHVKRNKTHPRLLAQHEPPWSCSGKRLSP